MAILYIDEPGSHIKLNSGLIVIEKEESTLTEVRLQEIENIIILENCSFTSAAAGALLRMSIPASFISRDGEYLGKLEAPLGKNITLRRGQYKAADDTKFCQAMAKSIVTAKLSNSMTILQRYNRSADNSPFSSNIGNIKDLIDQAASDCSMDTILGIEGSGAREYFAALKYIIDKPFTFTGRNRRPPEDPVNAMLGFAYALLETFVEGGVCAAGLDAYCGLYHQERYGREGLALDLMEEFRPVIADSVVINCCSRKMLDPVKDFEERDGGIFLNESGRQKFYRAFTGRIREEIKPDKDSPAVSYQKIIYMQAYKMAKCILNTSLQYDAFLIK